MRQIVYLLSGNDVAPPILDRQLDRFVQRMRDDVEDIIWNASFVGSSMWAQLLDAYEILSIEERVRLFMSPNGFEAVYGAKRSISDRGISALLAELRAATNNIDENEMAWPADSKIGTGSVPDSLRLGETIKVDLGSHHCRRIDITSPIFASAFEEFSLAEADSVREKLHMALAEIEANSPVLARLIRNYTRVIYVRKADNRLPSSEQVDSELGAIRLLNVHSNLYIQDQVVDDLIHESIHNLLGTFEYLNYPFIPVGHRPAAELRPVSPWSMRSIQLLPFLHAAFVYFGMLHYSERALQIGGIAPERRKSLLRRRNRYASGFLMPGNLSDFASSLGSADPRVLLALDWMQQSVRGRHGNQANIGPRIAGDDQEISQESLDDRIAA